MSNMLFIPDLNLITKIYSDKKGEYVILPNSTKKLYLEKEALTDA